MRYHLKNRPPCLLQLGLQFWGGWTTPWLVSSAQLWYIKEGTKWSRNKVAELSRDFWVCGGRYPVFHRGADLQGAESIFHQCHVWSRGIYKIYHYCHSTIIDISSIFRICLNSTIKSLHLKHHISWKQLKATERRLFGKYIQQQSWQGILQRSDFHWSSHS